MIKAFKISALAWAIIFSFVHSSYAVIKFDGAATTAKATETVSSWLETAKKQMDESVTLQTMIAYGKGAMETAKALQEMKENPLGVVQDMLDETGVVDSVTGAVSSVKDTAANAVGETVGGAIGDINKGIGSVTNSVQAQEAQKLLTLKDEKASIEAAQTEALGKAEEDYNNKVKLANDNIAKLNAMIASDPSKKDEYQSQITSYENQKADYKTAYDQSVTSIKSSNQSKLSAIEEQMYELRSKASEAAGKAAADKLKSLKGDDDGAAELQETIAKNFLKEDAAESSENIVPLVAYRNFIAMQDSVQAFNTALVIKKTRYADNDSADETADKVVQMDGATSSLGMDTKLKIENMKSILKYNDLLLQDMKMKTATELAKMKKYKLTDYSKNVTEFNLDDYVFNKKSTKEKLTNLAKGFKEGGLEGAAGVALGETGVNTGSSSSGGENSGSNTGTNVYEELMRARAGSGKYMGTDSSGPTDAAPVDVDEELERAREGGRK